MGRRGVRCAARRAHARAHTRTSPRAHATRTPARASHAAAAEAVAVAAVATVAVAGYPFRLLKDEAIRNAVRIEMASSTLTQHSVAQLVGVSQPVLCTWLGGRQVKAKGKNSHNAVKAKLLNWLSKRGIILSPSTATPDSTPSSPTTAPVPSACEPTPRELSKAASKPPSKQPRSGGKASDGGDGGGGWGSSSKSGGKVGKKGDGGGGESRDGGGSKSGSKASKKGEGSKSKADGEGGSKAGSAKIKLTPQHLYVAYVWYLKQREATGEGRVPGEEEAFCLKCKDGGDVLLCDYSGCVKSYHTKCCGLKAVPEGIWECPRHRCVRCGSGPSQTDAQGKPRTPDTPDAPGYTLWPCRTCPVTYCQRCLPEDVTFAGSEIVCESCQEQLSADMSSLQRDLIKWKPERFAAQSGSSFEI